MWWLILVVLAILSIEFIIFIIAYGIRLTLRLDINNMSICLKCYALDYIEIACVKLFVCDNNFYYQINRGQLKTIKLKEEEEDKSKKKKKLQKGAYISHLWGKRPQVSIKQLNVNYADDIQDAKNRALFDCALAVISNTLLATTDNKLKVNDFRLQDISGKSNFNGVYAECVLGFALFKVAFFAIYAFLVKRKYQVKA